MDTAMALAIAHEMLPRYDAFQDNPWANLFREMDREVPWSRFVLTVRPEASMVGHVRPRRTPMPEWSNEQGLRYPIECRNQYVERYRKHHREVLEHSAERPHDPLVMDITDGEDWPRCVRSSVGPFPTGRSRTRTRRRSDLRPVGPDAPAWRVRWATRRLRR
jgi:hypothetical protein